MIIKDGVRLLAKAGTKKEGKTKAREKKKDEGKVKRKEGKKEKLKK